MGKQVKYEYKSGIDIQYKRGVFCPVVRGRKQKRSSPQVFFFHHTFIYVILYACISYMYSSLILCNFSCQDQKKIPRKHNLF
jgi:hypothetical protein